MADEVTRRVGFVQEFFWVFFIGVWVLVAAIFALVLFIMFRVGAFKGVSRGVSVEMEEGQGLRVVHTVNGEVVSDTGDPAPAGGGSLQRRLEELNAMRASGAISSDEYVTQRERILGSL